MGLFDHKHILDRLSHQYIKKNKKYKIEQKMRIFF